jgi:predicted MFS family arabinose efflux permease
MANRWSRGSLGRFLAAAYAYAFLFDFILAYAIYTALMQVEGLGAVQIGGLLAFWSLCAIVFEMPSGALADRFDRRWLLVAAPLVKALTFICMLVADGSVLVYGLAFLFWSAGQSLYSGTIEALLYERLERDQLEDEYDRIYGRLSAAESLGIGTGTLLGGFVAAVSLDLTLWLALPPLLLCALSALALVDSRRAGNAGEAEDEPSYWQNFRNAFGEFRTEPQLRVVTLYIAVGLILFEILEEFDQLYYLAVSLPLWLFGVAGAAGMALHAFASIIAHRLAGHRAIAWALPLLGGLLLIIAAFGQDAWFVLVLELGYLAIAPAAVLAHARFQQLMEGRSRATTTSALEVAQNLTGVVVTFGFGVVAEATGILPAYGWAGVAMLVIAAWVFVTQRRHGMRLT